MKKQDVPLIKAHVARSALYVLLLLGVSMIPLALGQRSATNSAIDAAKVSLAVGSSSTSEAAEAQPSPVAAATAVVVWDQSNNAGTAVTLSATFTDASTMNSDLAGRFCCARLRLGGAVDRC